MKYFWITLSVCLIVDVLCNSGRVIAKIKEFINLQENQSQMQNTYWFICYVKQAATPGIMGDFLGKAFGNGIPQFQQDFITDDADKELCFASPFHFIERMNAQDKEHQYTLVNYMEIEEEEYEAYKKIGK